MMNLMNWLKDEEQGQGMVEYGLIIAAVAVVAILTLTPLGTAVAGIFTSITGNLGGGGGN